MGEYKILTTSEAQEWNGNVMDLPLDQQDPYLKPEYHMLYENNENGMARCFVFKEDHNIALYPFLINSINNLGFNLEYQYFDIQGAYGYNGVYSNSKNQSFLKNLSNAFLSYCKENRIVAEFIRFNPLLNNHLLAKWIEPIDLLDNVFIPLTTYIDVWERSFHKKVREAVRKAIRNGLTYISFSGNEISDIYFNHFIEIYYHMLNRNLADHSYYFNSNYFNQIRSLLPNNILFSFALYKDLPVSAELIVHNSINAYAFLGGTLDLYYDKSPNTFLQNEIVKDLLNKGLKNYNRGGGLTRNDSIYLFKKSFSLNTSSIFYIGKKIHNEEVYHRVIKQWQEKFPDKIEKYGHMVLKYRY